MAQFSYTAWFKTNRINILLFIGAFIFALIFQSLTLFKIGMLDSLYWSQQAMYVQTGDSQQFNPNMAYGHPGGPIIFGTIVIHNLFKVEYDTALLLFLAFFNSFVIAACSLMCFILRKNNLWWLLVLGTLTFDRLYIFATPPSAIAALLIVFLGLITLWIYENTSSKPFIFILWSITAGLTISTRADIGTIFFIFLGIILWQKLGWLKILKLLVLSFLIFVATDYFMWFMPLQHLKDLAIKMLYHFEDFTPTPLPISTVLNVSTLAFISIMISTLFLFSKNKLKPTLPSFFVSNLLVLTAFLYAIFLNANYQTIRYFLPIIFLWQTFLSLYLCSFIPMIRFSFAKTEKSQEMMRKTALYITILIMVSCQAYFLFYSIFFL